MPKKGMRTLLFKSPSPSRSPPQQRRTFSESLMEETIQTVETITSKWDSSSSCHIGSLFSHSRLEAKQYLNSVKELQTAMQCFARENSNSDILVRAQNVMQIAMKRVQREFYQILSSSRDYLDHESVSSRSSTIASARSSVSEMEEEFEDELRIAGESISEVERVSIYAMADLRAIADCMIFSGYSIECVKIYKVVRKSIVDESLYNLGVEKLQLSAVLKMDWEHVELRIKNWLYAVKFAVKTLFYGERVLCDNVFSASESIRDSCFAEIVKEGAMILFGFPEIVSKSKKTLEKMFRYLDLYETIASLWPEIESIFNTESTSTVRSAAMNSLLKLGEAVRMTLTEFELAVQNDASKTPFHGGGIHPLTRYVMNYLQFLSDYSESLADIVADWPLPNQSPLPESYFENTESPISVQFAWLILVLLCKVDARAELFKDVALSYLFLANNLQYVVVKVRSSNLRYLLGDEWIEKHDRKVMQYAANCERMGWSKVFSSLPENPTAEITPEEANDIFKRFNFAFEEVYRKQSSWLVPDPKLRDHIKVSLARKLCPFYRAFYQTNRVKVNEEMGRNGVVRFAPDDLGNYLSDLFHGGSSTTGSVSSTSSMSSFALSERNRY